MDTLSVDRKQLHMIYEQVKDIMGRLELLLAEVGCIHANYIDVTTMDGSNFRKFFCPDCGETISEEIDYDKEEV